MLVFGYNLEIEDLTIKKLVYEKDWKLALQSFFKLKKEGTVKSIKLKIRCVFCFIFSFYFIFGGIVLSISICTYLQQ